MHWLRACITFLVGIFLSLPFSLEGKHAQEETKIYFAGTLLSFSPQTIPPGTFSFEEYLSALRLSGQYNSHGKIANTSNIHQYQAVTYFDIGLTDSIDTNILFTNIYTHASYGDTVAFGDTWVLFGFQLAKAKANSWCPDARLLVGENLPTGKYDRLNPTKQGIDGVGSGAFKTIFLLTMAKTFYFHPAHAFRFNPNITALVPTPVDIAGLSVYGGEKATRGKIKAQPDWQVDLACECNLTPHCIVGTDILYVYRGKASFFPAEAGTPLAGLPAGQSFSLAPCLEYNPSTQWGIEAGIWWTVWGKNTTAFMGGLLAFFWEF